MTPDVDGDLGALIGGLGSLVGKAGGGLLGLGDLGADLAGAGVSSDVVLGAATGVTGLGTILGTAAKGARLATAADVDAGLATTIGETIGPVEGSGIAGIAIEQHNLRPGESTSVYVIRRGDAP